jgi:hypothetical protein
MHLIAAQVLDLSHRSIPRRAPAIMGGFMPVDYRNSARELG